MLSSWSRKTMEGVASDSLLARPAAIAAGERIQMQFPSVSLTAGALYDRHLREVYRYVSRRISRNEDAEDITAEVFHAAFRCLGKLQSTDNPRVWLFGIARRRIVDHLRLHTRQRELLNADLPDSALECFESAQGNPESEARRVESRHMIRQLMNSLSEGHREALLLQYVEELSIAEVAQVMGRSLAATNSLLQRARAAVFRDGHSYFLNTELSEPEHVNTRTPERPSTDELTTPRPVEPGLEVQR